MEVWSKIKYADKDKTTWFTMSTGKSAWWMLGKINIISPSTSIFLLTSLLRFMLEWSIDIHSTHITPLTLKIHIQTQHFLCILTIPLAATCPQINGNTKHTIKICIQLDGSQACSAIWRPQSKQTTTNLQTLIIHVLLTSLIELWPLTSICNLWTSIRMNNHKSSYSDYSCLVHFYNRIANIGPRFATSKLNLELVGRTSSFTL